MRLKGKDVREYEDVGTLAEAIEGGLNEFVARLQISALKELDRREFKRSGVYLGLITEINQKYGTDYSTNSNKIKVHFESPARG